MMCRAVPAGMLVGLLSLPAAAQDRAQDARIASALSAAPEGVAARATVREWGSEAVLRAGDNAYTCFPSMPGDARPMCLDEPWIQFIEAFLARKQPPPVGHIAVGYWLQGASTDGEDFDGEPHIALLAPRAVIDSLPDEPSNGAPWVMWKGTPFEHVMILVTSPSQ